MSTEHIETLLFFPSAVRIKARKIYQLKNSESQFNNPPVARIMVDRNKPKFKKSNYEDNRNKVRPGL